MSDKCKYMDIGELKEFGRDQSIEQNHAPLNNANPDGNWNNAYTDRSIDKKGFDQ